MPALYSNFQSGTITDSPLSSGATTINSSAFANLPTVAAPNTMFVVLDPDGSGGAPEVVLVTAHTAAATSVTVTRGQQGTTARSHVAGTVWRHAVLATDLDGLPAKLLTTTGDLVYASAAYTPARLAVGASGTVLKGGTTPSYGQVSNSDIAPSAGIAISKIAAGTAGQVLMAGPTAGQPQYTDFSGDVTVSSTGVTTIGNNRVGPAKVTTGSAGQALVNLGGTNQWGAGYTVGATASRPSGAEGMAFYDTTLNYLELHDGTNWTLLQGAGTYTPNLTNIAAGTGGSAANTADWTMSQGLITIHGTINYGTSSFIYATSNCTIQVPAGVTLAGKPFAPIGRFTYTISGTIYDGIIWYVGSATFRLRVLTASGSYVTTVDPSATVPAAVGAGDHIEWSITCPATMTV